MTLHFTLNLYWLLLPLGAGLSWWVVADRDDEHGYLGGIGILFRLPVAVIIFLLAVLSLVCGQLPSQ